MPPQLLDRLTTLACCLLLVFIQPGGDPDALRSIRAKACEAMPPGLAAPLGAGASRVAAWAHLRLCGDLADPPR